MSQQTAGEVAVARIGTGGARTMTAAAPFAVVELFSSEGCSSCPPADELLGDIARDARERGRPVFALAFHVDYWARLGWADRFADEGHAARQMDYARALNAQAVYTPQMVVNGSVEFVGSDRRRAAKEIESALTSAGTTLIALSIEREGSSGISVGERTIRVAYELHPAPAHAVLNVAVVEGGLISKVLRGENAGRTLRHDSVVRAFRSVHVDGGRGTVELDVPADVVARNASIVAYLQGATNPRIVGAAAIDFPDRASGR